MDIGPATAATDRTATGFGAIRGGRRRGRRLAAPLHQFFATSPVACPYVPGRAERKLIVELGGSEAAWVL